jgi:hypothetical protein
MVISKGVGSGLVAPISSQTDILYLTCKPNPTTGVTVIEYNTETDGFVSIKLYSMTGHLIQILSEAEITAGSHSLNFNCSNLTNGVYNL